MTTVDRTHPATMATMGAYNARKHELLGGLTGTVLEIGAGSGANLGYYRRDVRWLGLEPGRARRRRLERRAAAQGRHGDVIAATAEDVPLADASVDAVVAVIVLCSVADQDRALAEVRRVLRPGGSFVFFEHVAAPAGTAAHRMQRMLAPLSRRIDAGCDPARQTWRAIRTAGFRAVDLRWYTRHSLVYSPFIGGVAHT